jgi:hypothetical protein
MRQSTNSWWISANQKSLRLVAFSWLPMIPALDVEPNPTSAELMASIDCLSSDMRALVHEYGAVIVGQMLDDGYQNADELGDILRRWRERRQEQWLATNYITARMREGFECR